jgi:hypothetical protein
MVCNPSIMMFTEVQRDSWEPPVPFGALALPASEHCQVPVLVPTTRTLFEEYSAALQAGCGSHLWEVFLSETSLAMPAVAALIGLSGDNALLLAATFRSLLSLQVDPDQENVERGFAKLLCNVRALGELLFGGYSHSHMQSFDMTARLSKEMPNYLASLQRLLVECNNYSCTTDIPLRDREQKLTNEMFEVDRGLHGALSRLDIIAHVGINDTIVFQRLEGLHETLVNSFTEIPQFDDSELDTVSFSRVAARSCVSEYARLLMDSTRCSLDMADAILTETSIYEELTLHDLFVEQNVSPIEGISDESFHLL